MNRLESENEVQNKQKKKKRRERGINFASLKRINQKDFQKIDFFTFYVFTLDVYIAHQWDASQHPHDIFGCISMMPEHITLMLMASLRCTVARVAVLCYVAPENPHGAM